MLNCSATSVTRSVDNVYQVDILTISVDKIFGNKNAMETEFVIEKKIPPNFSRKNVSKTKIYYIKNENTFPF